MFFEFRMYLDIVHHIGFRVEALYEVDKLFNVV